VVPLEWTDGGDQHVSVFRPPTVSAHLRRTGDDVAVGAKVLSAGVQMGAVQAALLASIGRPRVRVHPRPRVTVVATGDAMLEAGDAYEDGHVYDGVSHALVAACREAGATPYRLASVRTTVDGLTQAIEDHLIQSDMVLVAGTVRAAGYDPIGEVLGRLGQVGLRRVAMDPAPLQVFGRIGHDRTPVFVVPVNPVPALIAFEVFVRPALRRMVGATSTQRPQVRAALTRPITSVRGQRQYLRAQVRHDAQRGYLASPIGVGTQTITSHAAANALVVVPEALEKVDAGTPLATILLERRGA
jgi:molybdopterin molybdotransferase